MVKYKHHAAKAVAREQAIGLYREAVAAQLPKSAYYWTLANDQSHDESEILQLMGMRFLQARQFIGVDYDTGLIAHNRLTHPEATWIDGDMAHVLCRPCNQEFLEHALVHLDTVSTPKNAWPLLDIATRVVKKGAILHNVVSFSYGNPVDYKDLMPHLPDGWKLHDKVLHYSGTPQSQMSTFLFTKGV